MGNQDYTHSGLSALAEAFCSQLTYHALKPATDDAFTPMMLVSVEKTHSSCVISPLIPYQP